MFCGCRLIMLNEIVFGYKYVKCLNFLIDFMYNILNIEIYGLILFLCIISSYYNYYDFFF